MRDATREEVVENVTGDVRHILSKYSDPVPDDLVAEITAYVLFNMEE